MNQYGIQVHEGQWKGEKPLFKFGLNQAVGTGNETIWEQGGVYSYLTSASTLKVSSSSAADDSAGTGVRTVEVFGLDANYNEVSETVTMDGQTGVDTTTEFLRVYRVVARSAGTGGTNAGDIYLGSGSISSGVPANKYAKILAGEGQTLMALWTVPAGYTAYIMKATFSSGTTATNKYAEVRLKVRPENEVFQTKTALTINQAMYSIEYDVPIKVTEKSDIEVQGQVSSGTDEIAATFTIVYKKN